MSGGEAVACLRHVLELVGHDWQLPVQASDCLEALTSRVIQGASLLKAFALRTLKNGQQAGVEAAALAEETRKHERAGCLVVAPLVGASCCAWRCETCGQAFATQAAMHAHLSKKTSTGLRVAGSVCQSYAREFWSTDRLRAHVRSVDICAARYQPADCDMPQSHEVQGQGQHAWRPV